MPTVTFRNTEIECAEGDILRTVLTSADLSPHNGVTGSLNCGGHGTCGTCAVEVSGETNDMTDAEKRRLSLPPHSQDSGLRLSCQARVEGDIEITKHDGFFGQRITQE